MNMKVGICFGGYCPMHQGHLDVIMRAKKENDVCFVVVCGYDNEPRSWEINLNLDERYNLVKNFFINDEQIIVLKINDTELGIDESMSDHNWTVWQNKVKELIFGNEHWRGPYIKYQKINEITSDITWYVAEPFYKTSIERNNVMNGKVILIDKLNPVSGTLIRNNPIKYWNKISKPFKPYLCKNILIIGTASEGKTTLVKDLGKYFNAPYSHEYARDYMQESNVSEWELDGADYMAFLDGQYQMNKKLINSPSNQGIFFADSDSMTTRMYAEYYSKDSELELTESEFEEIAVAADAITKKCRWDKIYLLCPHGVFVDDHTRYMACGEMKERQELFDILCQNIKSSGNWDKVEILDGGYWSNFNKIVNDVKEIMNNGKVD